MERWATNQAPRLAKTVAIIGGGSSLVGYDWHDVIQAQAQGRVFVIGVNDAYRFGFPDLVLFGDSDWWTLPNRGDGWSHRAALDNYERIGGKMVVTCAMPSPADIAEMEKCAYLKWIKRGPQSGLSTSPDSLAWNGNTGAAAINLALLMGATTVLLYGFDCKTSPSGKGNWHLNVKQPVPHPSLYQSFKVHFGAIAEQLPKCFPETAVLNAGPDSDLEVFPKINGNEIKRWL